MHNKKFIWIHLLAEVDILTLLDKRLRFFLRIIYSISQRKFESKLLWFQKAESEVNNINSITKELIKDMKNKVSIHTTTRTDTMSLSTISTSASFGSLKQSSQTSIT